jgi:hypothetical protein
MQNPRSSHTPVDRKDAAGFQHLGLLTQTAVQHIAGTGIDAFAQVDTTKVLFAWYVETQR